MHKVKLHTYVCPECNCHLETTRTDNLLCCPNFRCLSPLNRSHIQNTTELLILKSIFYTTILSIFEVLASLNATDEDLIYDVVDDVLKDIAERTKQYL